MTNKKLQTLDAVQSLIVTAIKWIGDEFPNPILGVEEQTLREVLNDLTKTNTALVNLLAYEQRKLMEQEYNIPVEIKSNV